MKTAFSTGPGFYAAATRQTDDTIPAGTMRFFIARLEAYDGPAKRDSEFADTSFTILTALTEEKPAVARALLQLHAHIEANLEAIRHNAKE